MQIQPYLFFEGRCDEAIEFYRRALGAELNMLMRFKDSPDPRARQGNDGDKVMHASLRIGETTMLASDGHCQGQPGFHGFAMSLTAKSDSEAERLFGGLADGGKIQMPMASTFFASRFGMVSDRFGVLWMVYVPSESHAQPGAARTEATARR